MVPGKVQVSQLFYKKKMILIAKSKILIYQQDDHWKQT